MKFLVVVTQPSIYHGCTTRKKFWEEKFTGKEDLFLSVNMKNCGCRKVRKHTDIKDIYKIVTLDISSKFDSLKKMKTTSSESKEMFWKIRKGVGNHSGFQDQSKVLETSVRKTFLRLSKSLRKLENYLKKKDAQKWAYSQLLSSSKATCEV